MQSESNRIVAVMVRMTKCNTGCPYIDNYVNAIRSGEILVSTEMHKATDYIQEKLSNPDVWIDLEKIEKARELIERYFEMKLRCV